MSCFRDVMVAGIVWGRVARVHLRSTVWWSRAGVFRSGGARPPQVDDSETAGLSGGRIEPGVICARSGGRMRLGLTSPRRRPPGAWSRSVTTSRAARGWPTRDEDEAGGLLPDLEPPRVDRLESATRPRPAPPQERPWTPHPQPGTTCHHRSAETAPP